VLILLERIDAIELDVLLSEVTLMHTRAELFWRFLRRRLMRPETEAKKSVEERESGKGKGQQEEVLFDSAESEFESEEERKEFMERMRKNREERLVKLDSVLNRSALNTRMQVYFRGYKEKNY
jgi:hypothetical protein